MDSDRPRRAIGICRCFRRYQAEIPATKKPAATRDPTSMCRNRIPNEGLKMTRTQSWGWNCPLTVR